ncbi:hypothetical protein ES703_29027 [subsurface metagenome]
MFYVGKKINSWVIILCKRVDDKVCNPHLPHGDYYMVKTAPDENIIIILRIGENSEHALRRAIEKELKFIRSLEGTKITLRGGWK